MHVWVRLWPLGSQWHGQDDAAEASGRAALVRTGALECHAGAAGAECHARASMKQMVNKSDVILLVFGVQNET